MASVSRPVSSAAPPPDLNLLLTWSGGRSWQSWVRIAISAVAMQTALLAVLIAIAGYTPAPSSESVVRRHQVLYLPSDLLTQKPPNQTKPPASVDLADLQPSRSRPAQTPRPAPSVRHVELPKPAAPQAAPEPVAKPTPPVVAKTSGAPSPGVPSGLTHPPETPPQTNPAQPFQDLGSDEPAQVVNPALRMRASVDAAVQSLAQTPQARRMIVTDNSPSPRALPGIPGASASPNAAQHVQVELQSDGDAPDFRAYLARILAIVRSNWRRVTPESVHLGTLRGQNTVELIIERDGNIPKLVIGQPSNIEALDQASVAAVSMSNRLPPLPDDFKGNQVRLAFTFKYNVQE